MSRIGLAINLQIENRVGNSKNSKVKNKKYSLIQFTKYIFTYLNHFILSKFIFNQNYRIDLIK